MEYKSANVCYDLFHHGKLNPIIFYLTWIFTIIRQRCIFDEEVFGEMLDAICTLLYTWPLTLSTKLHSKSAITILETKRQTSTFFTKNLWKMNIFLPDLNITDYWHMVK